MSLTGPVIRQPREAKTRDYRRRSHGKQQTKAERENEVAHIRKRDGGCVLAQMLLEHVCRNANGAIPWNALNLMSIEHVLESPRMGKRPPLDRWHAVLACPWSNIVTVETSKHRDLIRQWIADHEPKEETKQ